MMKNKSEAFASSLALAFLMVGLTSCQTHQVTPGAERIRVFETEPKNCIFVGEISVVQEDSVPVGHTTEPDMSLDTRIDLRNKAYTLGGNVLVFTKSKKPVATAATATAAADPKKAAPAAVEEDKGEKKVNTTFLATTFRCPASVVNQ